MARLMLYLIVKMSIESLKKIIWAMDPFEPNQEVYGLIAQCLQDFVSRTETAIEPVYVLSESGFIDEGEEDLKRVSSYQAAAKRVIQEILNRVQVKGIKQPRVLVHKADRHNTNSEILSEYARSVSADIIWVNPHGRAGVKRLLFGSFTEDLLAKSKVPVMVIPPMMKQMHSLNQIIFPSNLACESRFLFRKVVKVAKKLTARLTLFHSVLHPIDSLIQSGVYLLGGGTWVSSHSYLGKDIDQQSKCAEVWARWATRQGVPTDYVIESAGGPISASLSALAKRKAAGLIIMEGHSSSIESMLIGSITREVIRNADCPVWVIRTSMLREKMPHLGKIGKTA